MPKVGIIPGEHSLASTMEAFAKRGDVDKVLALMKVKYSCIFFVVVVYSSVCFIELCLLLLGLLVPQSIFFCI